MAKVSSNGIELRWRTHLYFFSLYINEDKTAWIQVLPSCSFGARMPVYTPTDPIVNRAVNHDELFILDSV